jgi:hypothetical protein
MADDRAVGQRKRTSAAVSAVRALADDHAIKTRLLIERLQAAGVTSLRALARELNQREVASARGGQWTARAVKNVLARTESPPRRQRGPAEERDVRRAEGDARDYNAGTVVRQLYAAGVVTLSALVRELNARNVLCRRGGRWHDKTIRAFLARQGLLPPVPAFRPSLEKAQSDAQIVEVIGRLLRRGVLGARRVAAELNRRQIPTSRGKSWRAQGVSDLLQRVDPAMREMMHRGTKIARRHQAPVNLAQWNETQREKSDVYARGLEVRLNQLIADGFRTVKKLYVELNRLKSFTPTGKEWTRNSLDMYFRNHFPEMLATITDDGRLAEIKFALDGIARRGIKGATAIAREFNRLQVPLLSGIDRKWRPLAVSRLLKKLGREHLMVDARERQWKEEPAARAVKLHQTGMAPKDIAWDLGEGATESMVRSMLGRYNRRVKAAQVASCDQPRGAPKIRLRRS